MHNGEKLEKALEKGWSPIGSPSTVAGTSQAILLYHEERKEIGKITVKTSKIPELGFEE